MQQQHFSDLQQQQQQNGALRDGVGVETTAAGGATSSGSPSGSNWAAGKRAQISGGRFDFEDGGTYCGGWDDGKAHGHGVCTGPKHQGAYAGAWNYGFEVSGVYIWPSGSHYEGQWQNGRRHGLGVEQRGRLIYRGEWSKDGHKGRYGVRESTVSTAKYEGTWNVGYQDGYGCETYADGGTYQGQWQEGKRHGYGMRTSAPFGMASHYRPKNIHASMSSLRSNENADPGDKRNSRMDEIRGGFVLTCKSDKLPVRRNSLTEKSKKGFLSGLKMRKQRSTGDLEKRGTLASGSIRSTMSTTSWLSTGSEQSNLTAKSAHTESNASFTMDEEQLDPSVVETYMGEWKKDKRCGYGVAERSDGLKYEGEWYSNKKHGYGVTTFRDGTVEEGKYKNNILITSQKKKHLFLARSRKFRERITASVSSAQRALKMALQRSDIAISRTATAAAKAQNADTAAEQARIDCENAVSMAREFAPDFKPSVLERFEKLRFRERYKVTPADQQQHHDPSRPPGTASPSDSRANIVNRNDQQRQQQQQQQQQSLAFHQQQPAMTRRPSQLVGSGGGGGNMNVDCPVPSSMYSQQLPVSPQTDLSSMVSPQQPGYGHGGHSNISAINQMYNQQHQPQQQQHLHQQSQPHQSNPQTNPAYQFQQQQPPGVSASMMGGPGTGAGFPKSSQNYAHSNLSNSSPNNQAQKDIMFRETEAAHTATNIQNQQQAQQQNYLPQQHQYQSFQQQHHQPPNDSGSPVNAMGNDNSNMLRRNSRMMNSGETPANNKAPMMSQIGQQSSIDHFDHYKRPPSRDSSVDRYARAASRLSGGFGSRQASIDRGHTTASSNENAASAEVRPRAGSVFHAVTPGVGPSATPPPSQPLTGNGSVLTGTGRLSRAGTPSMQNRLSTPTAAEPLFSSPNQPFEDVLLRQRTLGQDIIPSPSQPKRTESLYVAPKPLNTPTAGAAGGGANKKFKSIPINVTLQRKKSLPDFQELPRATEAMSREEVSALGSARREAVRRQVEVNERLKANPLLYLVSPQVKDWFSRQQLVLLVLFANIVLGILFFKMLT